MKIGGDMFGIFRKRCFAVLWLIVGSLVACNITPRPAAEGLTLGPETLTGKFVWHDLITDDVESAKTFYHGLFGWDFEQTVRPGGGDYVLVRSGSHLVGGIVNVEDPGDGGDYTRWLGYMSVEDVDEAVKMTVDAGGTRIIAARDVGNIGRAAAIQDPQGALLGLVHSHHGDPVDQQNELPGRIVWNELLASDDELAAQFYRDLNGNEISRIERRRGTYIKLGKNGIERSGILQRPNDNIDPVWLTVFAVEDPKDSAAKAESLGGQVLLPPSPDIREGTFAIISDPSGAVLVLQKLSS
jgi:predicted enzyme related to lactoylglutathione lyase